MNNKINNNQSLDEAMRLLPWYATGWLTPKERAFVRDMLEKYPELQDELELEYTVIRKVKEDKSILDMSVTEPTEKRLEKVLEEISALKEDNKTRYIDRSQEGFLQLISGFFSSYSSRLQYAGIAAVTALSVGLLYTFISPLMKPENVYKPATANSNSEKNNTNTTILLLGLNTEPSDPRFEKLVQGLGGEISEISGKDGMYRMLLPRKLNSAEIKALIQKITINKELVWFAGEAY